MKRTKFLLIFLILFYFELVYQAFIFKTFTFKSFIYISIFTLFTSMFINLISSLFNKKINNIIFISSIGIITLLFLVQFVNFQFYGNIVSIYSFFNGGQVFEFFGQIFKVILNNILPIILLLVPFILLLVYRHLIFITDCDYKCTLINTALLILFYVLSITSLNFDKTTIYSAKNVYFNKHAPIQSTKTLGLLTTMRIDIKRVITNFKEEVLVTQEIKPEEEIPVEEIIEYNMINIDFDNLIQNEKNSNIASLHNYFKNESPTKKNKYSGVFEGMNLIYIVAEAFSPVAVDPILTPTLHKLVNNGFVFNNFYTPVYYTSTSDGEYVTLTSLLPKESVWSMSRSYNISLPYAFGNVFSNLGYITNAYHNGTYRYYNRHRSHPNMGYNYMGCGNGMEKLINCKSWPQSDFEMIDSTFELYSNEENFMTYFLTVSGHLEYNFIGNNMAYKNKKFVDHLDYNNSIKAYIATQIELDRALELLIQKLDEKGILDNTVIAMSSDHYPYGLKTSEIKTVMDINDEKFDLHKNHLIIWNNTIKEPIYVDKISHSLDVLPTILNLFNIKFDSRLLIGKDILSDHEGLVIFNDRSWISDKGKYDATKKLFIPYIENIDDDYVDSINNIVYNKFVVSKNILENNYYKYALGE